MRFCLRCLFPNLSLLLNLHIYYKYIIKLLINYLITYHIIYYNLFRRYSKSAARRPTLLLQIFITTIQFYSCYYYVTIAITIVTIIVSITAITIIDLCYCCFLLLCFCFCFLLLLLLCFCFCFCFCFFASQLYSKLYCFRIFCLILPIHICNKSF